MRSFIGHIYHHHTVSVLGRAKHPLAASTHRAPKHLLEGTQHKHLTTSDLRTSAREEQPEPLPLISSQTLVPGSPVSFAPTLSPACVSPAWFHHTMGGCGGITPKSSLQAR